MSFLHVEGLWKLQKPVTGRKSACLPFPPLPPSESNEVVPVSLCGAQLWLLGSKRDRGPVFLEFLTSPVSLPGGLSVATFAALDGTVL